MNGANRNGPSSQSKSRVDLIWSKRHYRGSTARYVAAEHGMFQTRKANRPTQYARYENVASGTRTRGHALSSLTP